MIGKIHSWARSHKETIISVLLQAFLIGCLFLSGGSRVYAASQITNKFKTLYSLVKAIVQGIGAVMLLWFAFEFGNSMSSGEPSATSRAMKGIGGGAIMLIAPELAKALGVSF